MAGPTPRGSTQCPNCECKESRIIETRSIKPRGVYIVIRIRLCRYCGKKFRTKEIVANEVTLDHRYTEKEKAPPVEPPPEQKETPPENPFL